MKVMILAAGRGERMRPLTDKIPKPLAEVAGLPLIFHHLQAIERAGIKEVVINVHHLGEQIIAKVNQYPSQHLKISFSREESLLGTGGGIVKALSLLGNAPFIVISADIWTDYPLGKLPSKLRGWGHMVMVDNPPFHLKGDFHLTAEGNITAAEENKLTYASLGVFSADLFAGEWPEKFELRNPFGTAIAQGKMTGEHYQGVWGNIGTIAQLEALNRQLLTQDEVYANR
jgi:N-acetyl-alpha-D-muramate 1-phosphate uridylyltransferase